MSSSLSLGPFESLSVFLRIFITTFSIVLRTASHFGRMKIKCESKMRRKLIAPAKLKFKTPWCMLLLYLVSESVRICNVAIHLFIRCFLMVGFSIQDMIHHDISSGFTDLSIIFLG